MTQQIRDAPHHFTGSLVGEGQQQDAVRRDALFEQIGDPIRERSRLAGPSPSDDECRTGGRCNGGALLFVQFARVIDLKMNFRVKRLQNVLARHAGHSRGKRKLAKGKTMVIAP